MLASLFRGTSSQRTSQSIDSSTEDAHTRYLLFGQSQHGFSSATSPPPSPFGSPGLRPSSYDDRGGLELEEKDIRVLLAQDAYGGNEKPTLLFDSRKPVDSSSPSQSQPIVRSPLPSDWGLSQGSANRAEDAFRNRSSTFSSTQSSWSKANRVLVPKDDPFLDCMFGDPNQTKPATSTKMHIIPAGLRHPNAPERPPKRPSENTETRKRAPLGRAHTSGQHPVLPHIEDHNRDCLLITRLFHITLTEEAKVVAKPVSPGGRAPDKAPKLVERKVPAFAIGLVLQLPYSAHRPASSQSRAETSHSFGQSFASATSSYGSDMHSSWQFLDAIPASLSSSLTLSDDGDRRVDMVVDNWDIIVRGIQCFERVASDVVNEQLQRIMSQTVEDKSKVPKEKSMQRVNQRIVAIQNPTGVSRAPTLVLAATDVSRRIASAIRIPRVITGLGFTAGHWTDEARMLYRICGGKQQTFFLFNLLTAFLGNHTQWLERLAPEWYRKQFEAVHRQPHESSGLASRTVIVSEHKMLARRLIYMLASFLPGRSGIDGLHKLGEEELMTSSSYRSGAWPPGQRRPSKPYMVKPQALANFGPAELSTSASSHGSHASTFVNRSPRKQFVRKDSFKFQIKDGGIEADIKTGAGATSIVMPHAAETPTAYITGLRDSYFPETAIIDSNDSIATADLSKVLHKTASSHRRTSSVSSRWGSLVSGISEIWSNRPTTPGDRGSVTTFSHENSPAGQHKRATSSAIAVARGNPLQMMVDELEQKKTEVQDGRSVPYEQGAASSPFQTSKPAAATPKLHVDDKDGVVDVELDLPGFLSASSATPPRHQPMMPCSKPASLSREEACSIYSLRSIASKARRHSGDGKVNVAGYLKRHHEDFVLHAVRPYHDLLEDIKQSMRSERTPRETIEQILQDSLHVSWVTVCTTLVADTKPFTIRRLTLRRQYEVKSPNSAGNRSKTLASSLNTASVTLLAEEITDDMVMEFDTLLADAIEKALEVGTAEPARSSAVTRTHSRDVSMSSGRSVPAASVASRSGAAHFTRSDPAKVDQRNLVVGALEDIVRSVNNDLNNKSQHEEGNADAEVKDGARQESVLREGVKRWMRNVEQTSTEQTLVW